MSEKERIVYHYLHESSSGVSTAEWQEGDKKFFLSLPALEDGEQNYLLEIDPRDRRTLIVFDGHIPWGGLPKNSKVVLSIESLGFIKTPTENVRRHKNAEECKPFAVHRFTDCERKDIHLLLSRHFLLLPKSVSCVRKYDHKSLRPIYTFIEVDERGVTWRTSSYYN